MLLLSSFYFLKLKYFYSFYKDFLLKNDLFNKYIFSHLKKMATYCINLTQSKSYPFECRLFFEQAAVVEVSRLFASIIITFVHFICRY